MRLPYGFCYNSDGHIAIDNEKSDIVRMIYRQYLSGMSLGRIADFLYQQGIPSPTGKTSWTQPVISDLLSNKKYIGSIVSFDEYFIVQGEKGNRSNIDENTKHRKATRYSSQSVLSGLLICAECEHNYRRITRPSGEVVWRCANRVEHGKKFCKHSPSILEETIKGIVCERLGLETFDEQAVKESVGYIAVQQNGTMHIELRQYRLS
ncbi:recombinase family protein [uncultured Dysosmobacter sp.]|uniref:recombinase family protein n=1 Tax=uncultured Dysosmobacter sp. TaxID=2591384 RepID=UPI002603DC8A|nr:recombinase family protein [uncultured Dysosmobacter sp.]